MALTVEDGTGLANSDAYISETAADSYHTNHGNPSAWSGATTSAKEEAIRLATQYIDANYTMKWKGIRKLEVQALAWPRSSVYDYDGFVLSSDAIPVKLANACAILAVKKIDGDTLLPDVTDPSAIKRTKGKVGPLESEKEYEGGKSLYKRYSMVDAILRDYLVAISETLRS